MRSFVATAALAGAVSASPVSIHAVRNVPHVNMTAPTGSNLNDTSLEPCALVSQQWQQSDKGVVDSELAYQCLQSVPLKVEAAAEQLQGIKTLAQAQSTLAYLKNPPKGYLYPAVDFMGALDQVSQNLAQGKYENEVYELNSPALYPCNANS